MEQFPGLVPDKFYHIFNRANGDSILFFKEENYSFFLKRYDFYLSDFVETYAYCLLQNHFHLLVRIKNSFQIPEEKITGNSITSRKELDALKQKYNARNTISPRNGISQQPLDVSEIISEQFRRLFLSYTKAFNKQQGRTGNLFQHQFRRIEVSNYSYFRKLIYYIHHNPTHHGYDVDDADYKWSSYNSFILDKPTKLKREEVLKWFGGRAKYLEFHNEKQNLNEISNFTAE